ncbi:phosphopantetheine-binding protein [Kitasatospora sp. NBC_01287]|uniref:acyl carrier protein n=1 Tax=Kitasatospora sp. NBC_01287 TaxID=2903573 RepID=UPI002256C58D|nr:acyl carrier protein [Kitasatospora sp. NBC_01287]MCX4748919.1 phosphopantetheine-binding protein [Kitasatospora sp. NBC_01287]
MITETDFIRIVRDELALPLNGNDLDGDLDGVVSWDSLHMLRLVSAVERETGKRVPVGRLLADRSLRAIYNRVAEV